MKKILVPCDFSTPAVNAFRFAADVASQTKGEVHLVNVVELPVLHDTVLMPVLSFEEAMLKELKEKADKEFNKLMGKYNINGTSVKSSIVFGSTAPMLIDYAREHAVDLVVMGTHGASGLKEVLIGSTTEKIVRRSHVPVLAIREYVKPESIKNIVFPNTLDTENQEDLVAKVKSLQHFFGATLHLLWVNTPTNFTGDVITRERLQAFAKRFMIRDFTINIFNDPYEESGIISFTQGINADMIAMGTHGRTGLAHIFNGSLAEDVVNHVNLPIWTYTIKRA